MSRIARIVIAALAAAAPSPSAQTQELALGLIRPDGILTPLAVFDGKTWIDPWPESSDDRRLDRMLAALPSYWRDRNRQVPQAWYVTPRVGPALKANVLTHVIYDEHCGHQVGLLTDLPRDRKDPHDKRLATDRVVSIVPPTDLAGPNTARGGWQDLIEAMRAEVARQEASAKLDASTRLLALRITHLYVHADGRNRALYYRVQRQKGGRPYFVVTGWIAAAPGSRPVALETASGIGFGESHVASLQPLGVMRIGEAAVWVVQEHGYESEALSVLQVTPHGIQRVYNKFIGGC